MDIDNEAKQMASHLMNLARALDYSHPMTSSDLRQAAYIIRILVKRAEIERETK